MIYEDGNEEIQEDEGPTCHVIMGGSHYSLSEFWFETQWWINLLNQKTKTYCRAAATKKVQ